MVELKQRTLDEVKALSVEEATEIMRHAAVRWQWVKGHADHALNDRADRLAVAAARAAAA